VPYARTLCGLLPVVAPIHRRCWLASHTYSACNLLPINVLSTAPLYNRFRHVTSCSSTGSERSHRYQISLAQARFIHCRRSTARPCATHTHTHARTHARTHTHTHTHKDHATRDMYVKGPPPRTACGRCDSVGLISPVLFLPTFCLVKKRRSPLRCVAEKDRGHFQL